jgi:hypothetical protein
VSYAFSEPERSEEEIMKDLTVVLENRPGALAELGEATGRGGINIEGMSGEARAGEGALHILVEDAAATRDALQRVGIEVRAERDVLVTDVEDRPGTMGEVARKLAEAGVNIDLAYATFGGVKAVFGVDDLEKAKAAL